MERREILKWGIVAGLTPLVDAGAETHAATPERLFITSHGRTGIVDADGSNLKWLDFNVPGQATWQPGPMLGNGTKILLLSMEPRRDGPGKPFEEYYHQTPTHLWVHDLESGTLEEILNKDRLAPFMTPQLFIPPNSLLVQVVRKGGGQVYSVALDGSDAREFTRAGEGLPYGMSLSPSGRRVAYHLASPQGYQIWTCDVDGQNRKLVAGHPDHLYFGTEWSPDGDWILYQDCLFKDDPGHDWSDVCIGRADGGEHRVLSRGQSMWFAATYGNDKERGGGSNLPAWTPDGDILFPERLPGSMVAWKYRTGQPDLDHFNREHLPDQSKGGTRIVRMNPSDGAVNPLTDGGEGCWDFRATPSPSGRAVAYCRAKTGELPSLWIMNADGSGAREIVRGPDGHAVDHPRWLR